MPSSLSATLALNSKHKTPTHSHSTIYVIAIFFVSCRGARFALQRSPRLSIQRSADSREMHERWVVKVLVSTRRSDDEWRVVAATASQLAALTRKFRLEKKIKTPKTVYTFSTITMGDKQLARLLQKRAASARQSETARSQQLLRRWFHIIMHLTTSIGGFFSHRCAHAGARSYQLRR